MPLRAYTRRSASSPSTACWWQCGWAMAGIAASGRRRGACSPTRSSSSAKVATRRARRAAARVVGQQLRQVGAEHRRDRTVPAPPRARPRRAAATPSEWRSTRRAMPSCPVVCQVSPQQTQPSGSATSKPAASSTRTAACATSGVRWSLKVSGQSTTRPWAASGRGRGRQSRVKVRRASGGMPREGAMPAASVKSRRVRRERVTTLTSARQTRGQLEPQRQPAQRVVRQRAEAPAVMVVEELGLVAGHVHAGRAFRDAAAAGQAQVQRVTHVGRAPAVVGEARRPSSPGAAGPGRAWSAARRAWPGSWGTSAPRPGWRRSDRRRCSARPLSGSPRRPRLKACTGRGLQARRSGAARRSSVTAGAIDDDRAGLSTPLGSQMRD